eukprot:CAMPEP_0119349664 /NCGR_PEP_ID=MMETSP1333-20130426/109664_1 /TAXON_ID=418940 /ORGANISM="Scyphosphaera apsteinii, Strain RCC1455" /LENGTH=257 /DNA_ID=CAMNT_0007362265 /DNA_START=53 /DNA_END=826 /DNA_ORIENTATION=+
MTAPLLVEVANVLLRVTNYPPRLSSLFRRGSSKIAKPDVNPLETEAEKAVAAVLTPFQLKLIEETTRKLTRAGYTNARMLYLLDEQALLDLDIQSDRHRVLLAAWLHSIGFHDYGTKLVSYGCTSLRRLANMSDARLHVAGVTSLGQRRRLQRHIREELGQYKAVEPSLSAANRAFTGAGLALAEPLQVGMGSWDAADAADMDIKMANREAYHEEWRVTTAATLLAVAPGESTDHYTAKTPRQMCLRCADGTELVVG